MPQSYLLICRTCKEAKPEDQFYNSRTEKSGKFRGRCKPCNTAYVRKYRATENGAQRHRATNDKYEANNPDRHKAWRKAGKLPKTPCIVCGNPNVHRHHPDPSKPLSVVCLCPYHHRQADMNKLSIRMVSV